MESHGIARIVVTVGLRVLLAVCTALSLFLWAFREWAGGTTWILGVFTLIAGTFPDLRNRIPVAAMWAAAGFACGGVIWWIIVLNYVRG